MKLFPSGSDIKAAGAITIGVALNADGPSAPALRSFVGGPFDTPRPNGRGTDRAGLAGISR